MRVSVIIPTLNAETTIGELLSRLSSQSLRPLEVIVIDSSSEDSTVDIAREMGTETIVIPRSAFNHGGTRNQAAQVAQGDILAFMTQDALPFDNAMLGSLTSPLRQPGIAAAFARQIPDRNASLLETFLREFNYPEEGSIKGVDDLKTFGIKTFFFSDACSVVRKDALVDAGFFPEGVRANEDMILAAKLILGGHKIAYVPGARVIHSHDYSLLNQFNRYYNIGSSLRKNPWVLRYAKPEGEGVRFMKEQATFVIKRKKYILLPYIFLEALAKYAGFRFGLIAG
jgi:rhamnosyltransferase